MAKNTWTGRYDGLDKMPTKAGGWASNLWGNGKYYSSNSNLGQWFRNYAIQSGLDANVLNYLKSLDDNTLGSLVNEFWQESNAPLFNKAYTFDAASALQNLKELSSINLPEPSKSYEDIYNEMSNAIDAENAQAAALYDQSLNYQQNLYNSQMQNLNKDYNDYAKQVLAMDYQKNQQLLGSLEGSMNKARQNALEAGASAGIRLANNVNTLMSTQNQQAQQSLQTSNNLAQMLMNQRNAAMGLQGNLANAYSNNANQKAGLLQGTYERKQSNADNTWRINQDIYDDKVNRATYGLEGNTFKDSYLKYKQGQQSNAVGNQGY